MRHRFDGAFPKQILVTFLTLAAAAGYPLARFASREILEASITGAVISTVNVLLGYVAIEYAFDKSYTTFLKAVLGGMGMRMALMLGTMVGLIILVHQHAVALVVSVLIFHVCYLALEVLFIQKKMTARNQ